MLPARLTLQLLSSHPKSLALPCRHKSKMTIRRICVLLIPFGLGCSAPITTHATVPESETVVQMRPMGAVMRWQRRVGANGKVPVGALYRETVAQQQRLDTGVDGVGGPSNWTLLGPGNVGGRIRSILIHPTQPATMWIGSVGGGVWKTTNSGASWTMMPDLPSVLAVSCMVMHPNNPNVIYAGTGEACFFTNAVGSSNSAVQEGAGVFKSNDGGASWARLPQTAVPAWNAVSRLVIDKNNPLTMLASTISGIWRSTDGGATWSQRTTGNTLDLAIDPNDSTKAVAGRDDGFAQYSTDAGVTWTNTAKFTASTTRIEIHYAKSTPGMVYATASSGSISVWRSTNGGQSYARRSSGGVVSTLVNYNNALWVDPTNSNRILVGGLDAYRSTNGGSSFTKISSWSRYPNSAHADQHLMVEHPGFNGSSNSTVFFGNDGGIQRATNVFTVSQTSGWTNLANGLAITELYSCAVNPKSGVVLAGAQDNGTSRGTPTSGVNGWTSVFGGDGSHCTTDPNDPNYFYLQYQGLGLRRSSNGGQSSSNIKNGIVERDPNFIAYILLDPNNSNRLYACGAELWRTDNVKAGQPVWRSVKPRLPCVDSPRLNPLPGHHLSNPPCNISTVAVAEGNPNIVWVGHNNGHIYRTANALSVTPTWVKVDDNPARLPNRWVSHIVIDRNDPTRATVSFLGFAPDNMWRTTDSGASWNVLRGTGVDVLPAVPISYVVQHRIIGTRYYAATDLGLFYTEDDGLTWSPSTGGPSIVSIDQLVWKNDRTLVLATHGRSVWSCDVDPAFVTPVGTGCGTTGSPSLTATPPAIGMTQTYSLSGAAPSSLVHLLLAGGPPSPTAFGSCVIQPVLPVLAAPLGTTNSFGGLIAGLPIPASTALVGSLVTAQEFIAVSGGPLLGVGELSNGLEMTLGF